MKPTVLEGCPGEGEGIGDVTECQNLASGIFGIFHEGLGEGLRIMDDELPTLNFS